MNGLPGPATATFGPATEVAITPIGLAVMPNGDLLVSESTASPPAVARISSGLPGYSSNDILIPSEDGREAYVFDPSGRHLVTLDGLTGSTIYRFGYIAGQLTTVTDAYGNTTTINRDPSGKPLSITAPFGQQTTLALDPNGYLSQIADPAGDMTAFSYDATGLMQTMTDPRTNVHTFSYDPEGRLLKDANPAGGFTTLARTDQDAGFTVVLETALGHTTTFVDNQNTDSSLNRIVIDPAGGKSIQTPDDDGGTVTTLPDGTSVYEVDGTDPRFGMHDPLILRRATTTPSGNTLQVAETRSATEVDAGNPFSLSALNDTLTINGSRTYSATFDPSTSTWTDVSAGGVTETHQVDQNDRLLSLQPDPSITAASFSYDLKGRLSAATQGDESLTLAYDAKGRLSSATDALGHALGYGYDAADRVASFTLPSGRAYGLKYDASGNRTSITMPSGALHTLGYTPVDLPASYAPPAAPGFPSGGSYQDAYDLDQDPKQVTLPSGAAITEGYRVDGRPASVTYPEGSVAIAYADVTSRPSSIVRTPSTGSAETLAFSYDGPLLTGASFSGPATGAFSYAYDQNFFLTNVTALGQSIAIGRDPDGLTTSFGNFTITRNGPADAPDSISDPNLSLQLGYDALGHLAQRTETVQGSQVYQQQLGFDAASRLTQKVETVGAAGSQLTWGYGYDADGQLTSVTSNGTTLESYGYDPDGNRTSKTLGSDAAESATYDAQDRLIQRGGIGYTFDADGFLMSRGGDSFQYSRTGELLSATVSGATVTYAYDGLGRRVARTDASGTTQYLYGNPARRFELTAEIAPGGTATLFYYEAGGLYAFERGTTWYYVATDQVGTPLLVSDASGSPVRQIGYTAFGEVLSDSAPSFDLPVGFAGGLVDAVTGLVRFGYRDYEPASGRWVSKDPTFFMGGPALYAYASNAPTYLVDPTGQAWALGFNIDLTILFPFLSSGGGSAGVNVEYTSSEGLQSYLYATPPGSPSYGLCASFSVSVNLAWGQGGPWSGPFNNWYYNLPTVGGSNFQSPDGSWTGASLGVGPSIPPVGGGTDVTSYTPVSP